MGSGTAVVLGGRNWKRINEKTGVGFGRTEVSVRLDGIVFCALSFGHGPRRRGFEGGSKGVDFHVFFPQHIVEGLLNSRPREIAIIAGIPFSRPPRATRIGDRLLLFCCTPP